MTGPRPDRVHRHQPWMDEAACKGQTPLFFASLYEQGEKRERRERMAKRICANCPVRSECLDYALRSGEEGVWGCTNEQERQRVRRARGIKVERSPARHGTTTGYMRHGCRCEPCREANRQYHADYMARRRQSA